MSLYFSKKEVKYHIQNIRGISRSLFQREQLAKAAIALDKDADMVEFPMFENQEDVSGAVTRVVFTRVEPNLYTNHRIAYQMLLDKKKLSIKSFEKELDNIKGAWDEYHKNPDNMPL